MYKSDILYYTQQDKKDALTRMNQGKVHFSREPTPVWIKQNMQLKLPTCDRKTQWVCKMEKVTFNCPI